MLKKKQIIQVFETLPAGLQGFSQELPQVKPDTGFRRTAQMRFVFTELFQEPKGSEAKKMFLRFKVSNRQGV